MKLSTIINCSFIGLIVLSVRLNTNAGLILSDTTFKDSLCSFTWNSAVNDCPDTLKCIYPGTWQDKTVPVPANVSRIGENGLKLCLSDINMKGSAEIVYIMDLSGSMVTTGDPYKKRPGALLAGFTYQKDSASDRSRAGYVGFSSTLISGHLLPLTLVKAGWTQLANIVDTLRVYCNNGAGGGTNYGVALDRAISYFDDPGFVHDTAKAIIFISDGEPNANIGATALQVQTLVNKKIPVFGIFLGSSIGIGLDSICTRTLGKSYLVPPTTSTDTLANVVKAIVKSMIKTFVGKSLEVKNLTNATSANSVSMNKIDSITWNIVMDKSIFLNPGINNISVLSKFGTLDGSKDTTLAFQFKINVGGQGPTQACYWCWYRTRISVYNSSNIKVDTLSWKDLSYTVKVRYFGPDSAKLSTINVSVKTLKGDSEYLTLTKLPHDGQAQPYSKTVPFQVSLESSPAIPLNGTTEANFQDVISYYYVHPSDKQDTASYTVIVSAPPDSLKIFDKAGDPSKVAMLQYNKNNKIDTVTAGKFSDLYAKVFAQLKWLEDYENISSLSNKITWTIVNNVTQQPDLSIAKLTSDSGAHNQIFPMKAFHTVKVTAALQISSGSLNIALKKDIILYIQPGDPKQLVIESTNDFDKTLNKNKPCPYDPIIMNKTTIVTTAYAILRDSLGNWVRPAKQALWSSDSLQVVSIAPILGSPGSDTGTITKGVLPEGTTKIHAEQTVPVSLKLRGTSTVITTNFDIDSLRIVRIHGSDTADIEFLTMSQNDDTTLHVLGERSDTHKWIPVQANWLIDPAGIAFPSPPQKSISWEFSPLLPGTGVIVTTYTGKVDTVRFVFTVGKVLRATFRIVTPDSSLIAGKPILGEVAIYNKDGLVPGFWKYPKDVNGNGGISEAQYSDILDNGLVHPWYIPAAITDYPDSSSFSNAGGLYMTSVKQTYFNGFDTLTFYLYNAPPDKKPHKMTVALDDVSASTNPFILKPGPLDTIFMLIDGKIVSPRDTQFLTVKSNPFIIKAKGYDEFGNFLPEEKFKWKNDSSLIDFSINAQSDQIYFDPGKATTSQLGKVIVSGVSYPNITNHLVIVIKGPKSILSIAKTRDYNGNGLLDAIELSFDRPFVLPVNINTNTNFGKITVVNSSPYFDKFKVTKIESEPLDAKTFYLRLSETDSKILNLPQSSWTPTLTVEDPIFSDSIETIKNVVCADGAAPVIWTVTKNVVDITNPKKDVVTVKLSEKFFNANSSSFISAAPKPEKVFYVWVLKNNGKDTVPDSDSLFSFIQNFDRQENDFAVFTMSNGKELNSNNLLNLQEGDLVADNVKNTPIKNNQKVPVVVVGNIGQITIAPVPIIPTKITLNTTNGLETHPVNTIFNHVLINGGCLIVVNINIGKNAELTGVMIIFDAAGNPVYKRASTGNLLKPEDLVKTGIIPIGFSWNGITDSRMKAAPGVYKVVMHLKYKDDNTSKPINLAKTVAVGR
jgi:archaellum component FlaG (FlaF/FlaG flagellin family)